MKAAQISQYGTNSLRINKKALSPMSSAGRVLIEVYAAGVNPMDWKIQEGHFQDSLSLRFPATLGLDFSGAVLHVGEGVTGFKKGDEVYGESSLLQGWNGSFAEFVSADAKAIALKPGNITHVEAAVLPLAGVSAYRALIEHMRLAPGQKILIHGGSGGIGSIAIQIAKQLGAYVATTVTEKDRRFVMKLGADETIDCRTQIFENRLRNYDAVLDTVGGDVYTKSFKVLKEKGMIVSMLEKPVPEMIEKFNINAVYQITQVNDVRLNELAKLVELGHIKPHIDKLFSLDRAPDALHYKKVKHPCGKVVLQIPAHPVFKGLKEQYKKLTTKTMHIISQQRFTKT